MNTVTSLPMIVEFTGIKDHGPSDDGRGSTVCPHCGADGRYVHHFKTADGSRLAAMSGCVRLFPVHPLAARQHKIMEKESQGKKLNGWDEKILDTIQAWQNGSMSETDAEYAVKREEASRNQWMSKKFGGRR